MLQPIGNVAAVIEMQHGRESISVLCALASWRELFATLRAVKSLRGKLVIFCALLAAGVAAILFINNEPKADGHPLGYWLQLGSEQDANDILTLNVPARLQRVGREMKMLVENSDNETKADPGLLRIIARAHDLQERVMQTNDLTLHAIASQEHVTPGYVSRLLRLSSLAPDIITAIVNGKNPSQLTAKKLMRLALEIPVDWTAQRKLLGFHAR